MVNQKEALDRLNKEKNYEEKIANDLLNYYIISLDTIKDISEEQKKTIIASLTVIGNDSLMHSNAFNNLINYVLNNGETEY
jgi:hypothetical protein